MTLPPRIDGLLQRFLPDWIDRTLAHKAISFALVGCVNATVDFAVFAIGYFYFGLSIIPANLIAWCLAVANSYVLNAMTTFAAESGRRLRLKPFLAFAVAQAGGMVANTATVYAAAFFVPVLLAKVLAIGVTFVVDFVLSHFFVFRRREGEPPPY